MHHDHGHSHAPRDFGFAFAAATLLNFALVAAQVFYGLAANSIALLADAGHNFGDALGLLLAWVAFMRRTLAPDRAAHLRLSLRLDPGRAQQFRPDAGRDRRDRLEAIRRFYEPGEVAGLTVIVVAAAGIVDQRAIAPGC